jgi:hypothetical protein
MRRYTISIFISVLLFVPTYSQPTIEVVAGIHLPVGLADEFWKNSLENYWKPSLNVGVCARLTLSTYFNISSSLTYNHYIFKGYYYEGAHIEELFVATSGTGSNIARILMELQLVDQSAHSLKPYLVIGTSYVIESMGTIHGHMEYLGAPEYQKDIAGTTRNYFAYLVGGGAIFSMSNDIDLDFSARYYSNTSDRSYILYGIGIGYKILN